MEYSRQGHCIYYTRYHLVLATKYRRKILKSGMGAWLRLIILALQRRHPEMEMIEINTDKDYVHLLLAIAPKLSVSDAVNIIKSNSARAMRKKFPYLDKVYYDEDGIWSGGYFVSTVGVNEETIKKYIEQQGAEDSGQAKLEL